MSIAILTLLLFAVLFGDSRANPCVDVTDRNSTEIDPIDVTALILARGGSKGIRLKNIVRVGNQTLLGRALDTIRSFERFNGVWVSTDNELIADVAEKHCAKVFKRSPDYAKDDTPSIVSVQEFINQTFLSSPFIALIQVTSPFLREKYLNKAFEVLKSGKQCVFAISRSYKLRWALSDNRLLALNFDPANRPRRQDWSGEFVENGMFYIATKELLTEGKFQDEDCGIVEIEKRDSMDIDTEDDLKMVEFLLTMDM